MLNHIHLRLLCMIKAGFPNNYHDRESQWKHKLVKHDVVQWRNNFETAQEATNSSKWEKVKESIKELLSSQRSIFWYNYTQPLIVQGKLLKLIESESSDLTWRSIINTSTKVTWDNFDDLALQTYRVWDDLTSMTI